MGDNNEFNNEYIKIEEEFNTRCSLSTDDGLLHPSLFFPFELILQILFCLPVRSLHLFKCVCKSWKTLISNPQFAKAHLHNLTVNHSITHQRLIYFDFFTDVPKYVSFPMMAFFEKQLFSNAVEFRKEHRFGIIGSCNGLLCLLDNDEGYVKLWNPSTRLKSNKSPNLDWYDKYNSITYCGFGYDQVNDKYKVLVGVRGLNTRIYTFGGNSWTTIKNFPYPLPTRDEGKFVSGTLNWLIGVSSNQPVILSFDLEKETFDEVLLPNNVGVNASDPGLGVLNNCLCVYFDSDKTHWDIWLMKKYGVAESWTRLTTIPIDHRMDHSPFTVPLFTFWKQYCVAYIYQICHI